MGSDIFALCFGRYRWQSLEWIRNHEGAFVRSSIHIYHIVATFRPIVCLKQVPYQATQTYDTTPPACLYKEKSRRARTDYSVPHICHLMMLEECDTMSLSTIPPKPPKNPSFLWELSICYTTASSLRVSRWIYSDENCISTNISAYITASRLLKIYFNIHINKTYYSLSRSRHHYDNISNTSHS